MKLWEVRTQVHRRMLELRAVDTYLETDSFEAAWEAAKEAEREQLLLILKSGKLEPVKAWAKERLAGPLKFQSYRRLRELARRENIPRWSRLMRDELIEALEDRCNKPGKT